MAKKTSTPPPPTAEYQRSHVGLLRAVNLAGRDKLAMPALREAVESLGHTDVVTYIQSGNVVFRAARAPGRSEDAAIAWELEKVIAERTGVAAAVVVLGAAQLGDVIAASPFPQVTDLRALHAIFLREPPGEPGRSSVAAAVDRARSKGSRDDARLVDRVLYLWTPDGFGRSVLRGELERGGANATPMREGTARNWATVTALHTLVQR